MDTEAAAAVKILYLAFSNLVELVREKYPEYTLKNVCLSVDPPGHNELYSSSKPGIEKSVNDGVQTGIKIQHPSQNVPR